MTDTPERSLIAIDASYPDFEISGDLLEGGSPLSLMRLVRYFDSSMSDAVDDDLVVTGLSIEAKPKEKYLLIKGSIESGWALDIGVTTLQLASIELMLERGTSTHVEISGIVLIGSVPFDLTAAIEDGGWSFDGGLSEPPISLGKVLEDILQAIAGEGLTAPDDLKALMVSELRFSATKADMTRTFGFQAGLLWERDFDGMLLSIDASLDLAGERTLPAPTGTYSGAICGAATFTIDGSDDFLSGTTITACVEFQSGVSNSFKTELTLEVGRFAFTGAIETRTLANKTKETIVSFGVASGYTLADMLEFLVQLVDPAEDGFTLEDPWHGILDAVNPGNLALTYNLTKREIGIEVTVNLDYGFVDLDTISMKYSLNRATSNTGHKPSSSKTAPRKKSGGVSIALAGRILDKVYPKGKELTWDPMEEAAPATPGTGVALFQLDYLGLGQRVGFNPNRIAELTNVTTIMDELIDAILSGEDPASSPADALLVFNRDAGWLIGTKMQLLRFIDISIIFNDPVLYGLLIELSGDSAGKLAGLRFEILYRRITDSIGLYHTELTLPDYMRQIQLGAVAITLPIIVLDIYTNGDFMIDVGFPRNNDFSRSAVVEAGIFIGAGGFYFAKLSAATSEGLVPSVTNGIFNPVIAFGLGLRVGLGRTFNKGPLRAELTVTVQGIFEGVFSWFNPIESGVKKADYYWMQASVAIVGRLYGAVDFKVIVVEVEVIVQARIQLTIESYKAMIIYLEASVSVKASVKVVFVKVHFTFKLKISQQFTVGSDSPTPWKLGSPSAAFLAANSNANNGNLGGGGSAFGSHTIDPADLQMTVGDEQAFVIDASGAITYVTNTALFWDSTFPVWNREQNIDVYFQLGFSEGLTVDQYLEDADGKQIAVTVEDSTEQQIKAAALLFVTNSVVNDGDLSATQSDAASKGFSRLAQALLAWAIHAHLSTSSTATRASANDNFVDYLNQNISLRQLQDLHDALSPADDDDDRVPFSYAQLAGFLANNFQFTITDAKLEAGDNPTNATYFPMFPILKLENKDTNVIVDFNQFNTLSGATLSAIAREFKELRTSVNANRFTNESDTGSTSMSMAQFLFMDYFAAVTRMAVQQAVDYVDGLSDDSLNIVTLLDDLVSGGHMNQVSGMVSRFMLHGLRLPTDLNQPEDTYPLYALTGQQFDIAYEPADIPTPYEVELHLDTNSSDALVSQIAFNDIEYDENDNPIIKTPDPDAEETPPEPTSIVYRLKTEERELLTTLRSKAMEVVINSFAPMAYFEDLTKNFTLTSGDTWLENGSAANLTPVDNSGVSIWRLPDSLLTELNNLNSAEATLPLTLRSADQEGNLSTINVANYRYATMLEVQVARVPSADGSSFLADTYLVIGTTDTGEAFIERVWEFLRGNNSRNANSSLAILYLNADGYLTNEAATSQILKTNLQTMKNETTRNETTFGAPATDVDDFLRLLWQGSSVESGGYFLNYRYTDGDEQKSLPDHLFADGRTATIKLLIFTPETESGNQTGVYRHHNVMVFGSAFPTEAQQTILFAEADGQTVKAQTMDAGRVGFRVERDAPDDTDDDNVVLENLYQLLSYSVKAQEGETTIVEYASTLPLGPQIDDRDTAATSDDIWIYERAIPASTLYKGDSTTDSPYHGVSDTAAVKVSLRLRDIYGNRSTADAYDSIDLPFRYTDDIIGLNTWHSLSETYHFYKADSGNKLELYLRLQAETFVVSESTNYERLQQKVVQSKAQYLSIGYQIDADDMTLALSSSLSSNKVIAVDKATILNFIDNICDYLDALAAATPLEVTNGQTLQAVADAYNTSLLSLAQNNADVYGIFAADQSLTVQFAYSVTSGETLTSIANNLSTDAATIATANQDVALTPNAVIELGSGSYTVQAGETLKRIADDHNTTAANLAQLNQAVVGLWREGLDIKYAGTLTTTANDSLNSLLVQVNLAITAIPRAKQVSLADFVAQVGNVTLGATLYDDLSDSRTPVGLCIGSHLSLSSGVAASTALNDQAVAFEDWAFANQNIAGLIQVGVSVTIARLGVTVTTRNNETLQTLTTAVTAAIDLDAADGVQQKVTTVVEVAQAVVNGGALNTNALSLAPILRLTMTADYDIATSDLPDEAIFALAVNLTMARNSDYVADDAPPEVQSVTAQFSPHTPFEFTQSQDDIISLKTFTDHFEAAFPSLKLAVGRDEARRTSGGTTNQPQVLWVVQLGEGGINYSINTGVRPYFYAPIPLSTVLLAGDVDINNETVRYEDVDIDIWAQACLKAIDEFLDPTFAMPAYNANVQHSNSNVVDFILQCKQQLADVIAARVDTVYTGTISQASLDEAQSTFRQQLLISLNSAYTIETIVQQSVTVNFGRAFQAFSSGYAPRLHGKPNVPEDKTQPNYVLSTAKIAFTQNAAEKDRAVREDAFLTFLYNTLAPTDERQVSHAMTFSAAELEYNFQPVPGIDNYFASSWLQFVVPLAAASLGTLNIPIPLRNYPLAPSLIRQFAEGDPDNALDIAAIREWEYNLLYEHLEVAQDTILARIRYNSQASNTAIDSGDVETNSNLFDALARFQDAYPAIAAELSALQDGEVTEGTTQALQAFAERIKEVTDEWVSLGSNTILSSTRHTEGGTYYEIVEDDNEDQTAIAVKITAHGNHINLPLYQIPGYAQAENTPPHDPSATQSTVVHIKQEGVPVANFGSSDLPDRLLMQQNLDILAQQNAISEIWLMRNDDLDATYETNAKFIYQTPLIRFTNPLTPTLENTCRWNIAMIGSETPVKRTLKDHINTLFNAILPEHAAQDYGLRMAGSYAFAVVESESDAVIKARDCDPSDDSIFVKVPIIMSLIKEIDADTAATLTEQMQTFSAELEDELADWFCTAQPSRQRARFIFSLSLFSRLPNSPKQPILRIQNLELYLDDITDLNALCAARR